MAIYHCSINIISRSSGRCITAVAASRAGERIHDERSNLTHDYTRKDGVDHHFILAPADAPDWVQDRAQLWNAVEQVEKRKDAQLARDVEVALPRELMPTAMQTLVTGFADTQFVKHGMIADITLHHVRGDNPHASILLTTRSISANGFGPKCRDWNRKEHLQRWRKAWEQHNNHALAHHGHSARIDHRRLEEQGIERVPQRHLGLTVIAMETRGLRTERGDRALAIEKTNQQLETLRQQREALDARIQDITPSAERRRGDGGK